MTAFDPLSALAGGLLIGLAASALLLGAGRIAGISGILGGALVSGERAWRWAFLFGLIGGAFLYGRLSAVELTLAGSPAAFAVAGLLVGAGTQIGGGCTSGHGVCGIARLSPRSLVATATFMATAVLAVLARRVISGG